MEDSFNEIQCYTYICRVLQVTLVAITPDKLFVLSDLMRLSFITRGNIICNKKISIHTTCTTRKINICYDELFMTK